MHYFIKFNLAFFWILFFVTANLLAQKTDVDFDVFFKDEKIGRIRAEDIKEGTKSYKNLRTQTDTKVFFLSFHMESEVGVEQEKGVLTLGTAYRDSNRGPEDVEARVTKIGKRVYARERNGVKDKIKNKRIKFCVVDLYFKEPRRIRKVFSNMYAETLRLKKVSSGRYRLSNPDNNDSFYNYKDGKLISIEINTIAGTVLSKRI